MRDKDMPNEPETISKFREERIIHIGHGHGTFTGLDLLDHGHDSLVDRYGYGVLRSTVADVAVQVIDLRGSAPLQGLEAGGANAPML